MFYSGRRGKSTKVRRRATWREQGEGDKDANNEEELGLWFHQAYMIEFRSSGQNKGPKDIGKGRHEWQHSTHEDVKSEPRWITKGVINTSCMDNSNSRTKDHGFTSMRRYVRKSSSMTLNEALCGRQPVHFIYLFIYINMTVYIALFNRNIK